MTNTEPTRILAVRHGETAWNVAKRIQGHLDIALNDTGRWQAERAGAALADEPLAAVYASDLLRAFDTAQHVAREHGLAVVAECGLRERSFGEAEGCTYAEIEQQWPEQARRWRQRDPEFGFAGGETLRSFYERCVATAVRLAAEHRGRTIALVAHGGVLDCLYRAAAGIALSAPRTWAVGNASINRLLYTGEGFTLVGWADQSHLEVPARVDDDEEPA
jgi:probable phosphoglycerate mutase